MCGAAWDVDRCAVCEEPGEVLLISPDGKWGCLMCTECWDDGEGEAALDCVDPSRFLQVWTARNN